MSRREDDGIEMPDCNDSPDAIRRALEKGHYRDARPSEIEADIHFLLDELAESEQRYHDVEEDAQNAAEIESATRAKVEAECAQRTAEAVEAARREERARVLDEAEAGVRSALHVAGVSSDLAMRALARLRGEKSDAK